MESSLIIYSFFETLISLKKQLKWILWIPFSAFIIVLLVNLKQPEPTNAISSNQIPITSNIFIKQSHVSNHSKDSTSLFFHNSRPIFVRSISTRSGKIRAKLPRIKQSRRIPPDNSHFSKDKSYWKIINEKASPFYVTLYPTIQCFKYRTDSCLLMRRNIVLIV